MKLFSNVSEKKVIFSSISGNISFETCKSDDQSSDPPFLYFEVKFSTLSLQNNHVNKEICDMKTFCHDVFYYF